MKLKLLFLTFLFSALSWAQPWTENFDTESSETYGNTTLTINGRDWTRQTAGNFSYANTNMGSYAFTINDDSAGAHITTPSLNTCGTVSFDYAYINGNSANVFELQTSTDGISFSTVDTHTLGASANLSYVNYSYNLNNSSPTLYVRVLSDNQNAHLFIENFSVTAYAGSSPPVITSSLTDSGTVGAAYNYNIVATNSPTSYSATGLPAGLSINTTTGEITGTPTGAGSFNVSITATNAYGTDAETLIITIVTGPCIDEGFDAGTTPPSGWTFNSIGDTYTSASNFGNSSPSLKMDLTGDAITTSTFTNATELSFWLKGQATDASSSLLIEGFNGSWITIDNISNLPTTGTTYTYNSGTTPALPTNITQFRFTYSKSVGNLSFDDVEVFCGPTCTPPSDPVGTISGVTPACNTTALSYSESAVAPVEFYWQTTSLGTSTTNNASSPLVVTTSGDYYVRAFNTSTSCWSTAEVGPYSVVIGTTATITSQPVDATTVVNGGASFSVSTSGSGLSYQWQVDTGSGFVNVTDGLQYSGSTSTTLTISNATLTMDGYLY